MTPSQLKDLLKIKQSLGIPDPRDCPAVAGCVAVRVGDATRPAATAAPGVALPKPLANSSFCTAASQT